MTKCIICRNRTYFSFDDISYYFVNMLFFSIRLTTRAEAFIVEGTSIEHELVPIITSEIGVYGMFFILLLSDFDHLFDHLSPLR